MVSVREASLASPVWPLSRPSQQKHLCVARHAAAKLFHDEAGDRELRQARQAPGTVIVEQGHFIVVGDRGQSDEDGWDVLPLAKPALQSISLLGVRAMQLTAVLIPAEEGGYIALNPETGTTTQGESIQEALANLQEAVELYLEEFPVRSFGKSFLTTFEVTARVA